MENESDLTASRRPRYHRTEAFLSVTVTTMKRHLGRLNAAAILAILLGLTAPLTLRAQDAQIAPDSQSAPSAQPVDDQDPPGRVAQLSDAEGDVSLQPGGESDWIQAELNRPLVSGDNLWADQNSRAELHIGSTALRLGAITGITLLEVSDHATQIRLVQGSLIVSVRHVESDYSYEIDTPNVAFAVMQPGDYRLDVDAQGVRTDVTVWRGRGEVTGGGSSYTVAADQHVTFTGGDQLTYDVGQVTANDGLDTWAFDRNQAEDESDAANYVSPETTGYEDLDAYGDWTYIAGYGPAWRPRQVIAGWAPYRFGYWTWVGPWGWTWVAEEPWGFAPFHYGRWALSDSTWYWVPGPAAVRPTYAPALVGWVGGGPGTRFSFGAGVGWFPLAPGEVFVPAYRTSRTYMNTVNLTNTRVEMTKIANVYNTAVVNHAPIDFAYANRAVAGGATVVSRDTFINARSVAHNVVSVPEKELAATSVSHSAGLEPVRASVIGFGKPVGDKPPSAMASRQVVSIRTPTPIPSSPGENEAQTSRRLNQAALVRRQSPGTPVPIPSAAARQAEMQDGFHPFSSPSAENNQTKMQPRVWEEQGTPEPPSEAHVQPQAHASSLSEMHPPQQKQSSSQQQQQRSNAVSKPAAPVRTQNDQQQEKFSSWHQQQSWSPSSSGQKSASSSAAVKTSSSPPPPPK